METKILEVALQGALVPFEAVALPKARVVLRDEESGFDDQQLVRDFAYVVDRKSTGGARKTFFAERYGGLGIFNNGGGVRCGLTGDYQVKGIGLNPLLGRATPSSYRSGAMTGVEAVREFVWSHLVRLALPYG